MNYLAHFYLAFDDSELLLGQLLGDDVKGKKYEDYPQRIMQGILLHRFIDSTTDQHPICSQLRAILRPQLGLLSGVAIDVYFDHILAKNWNKYSPVPLEDFASQAYQIFTKNIHLLTPKSNFISSKMAEYNWLMKYENIEDTASILQQMAKRLPYGHLLEPAPKLLYQHFDTIEMSFEAFFPQLIDQSKAKLDTFALKLHNLGTS
jgi:acyl carrier protein phosphodiesterase